MSNFDEVFSNVKDCFGQYENWDNSWHCKGCPIKEECETKTKEKNDEQSQ